MRPEGDLTRPVDVVLTSAEQSVRSIAGFDLDAAADAFKPSLIPPPPPKVKTSEEFVELFEEMSSLSLGESASLNGPKTIIRVLRVFGGFLWTESNLFGGRWTPPVSTFLPGRT